MNTHVTRRAVLGGLVIGVALPQLGRAQSGAAAVIQNEGQLEGLAKPNAFIRIAEDDTVTVLIKHIEFGQGPYTGLTTLVAEEMDADWGQMRATSAPADKDLYVNSAFGIQGTGGSTAMVSSWEPMRKAGAAARAMLVEAAAEEWGVPAGEITVTKGRIRHEGSGNEAGFGAFATAAAGRTAPENPTLKDPKDYVLIGTDVPKVDTVIKTNGQALFTIDVQDDDMLVAAVVHPPAFGAKLRSFDAAEALKVNGVTGVKEIPQGLAIYAKTTYPALKARALVKAEWDESEAETRSSDEMMKIWAEAAAGGPGDEVEARGDVEKALGDGVEVLEAEYRFPFLAHAPMEPIDGVVHITSDGAQARMGSQLQTVDHGTIAGILGIDQSKVTIDTLLAGGSFGRRAQPDSQMAAEATACAMASGHSGPVKMVYTREDDTKGGYYRPLTVHRLRGAVKDGKVVAWDNTVATPSIVSGTAFDMMVQNGIDPTSVEGSKGLPYAIPDFRVTLHTMETKVPVLWWRSVGHTHTAYATECFLDELLAKGGLDPVEARLSMLGEHPRHAGVLRRVAEIADWQGGKGSGDSAFGVALHKSFDTYVAQIAEVQDVDGFPKVRKVWCAVDCGIAVNPNIVTAQMEGGIGFGLGAILFDKITLGEGGRVQQSNFDDYRMIRINEMPEVEVSIIDSSEPPTGVGEPGVPPIGPAVANAWRTLTGTSVRNLPFLANANA